MRRRGLKLLLGFVAVALLAVGWVGWRAYQVHHDLTSARAQVTAVQRALTSGAVDQAAADLPALRVRLDRAAAHSSGPLWSILQPIPVLGDSLHAARRAALAGQLLGDEVLPEGTTALTLLRRNKPLMRGRVDLSVLAQLQVHVKRAAEAGNRARALLEPVDRYLPGPVARGISQARSKVNEVAAALDSAETALQLAPTMLGRDGPRHYFVAVQNNAEARATGGLLGAFALVTTDNGKITLAATGTDTTLRVASKAVPADPGAAQTWQTIGSTRAWFDANLTPNFPDAGRNIAEQWTAQSGQKIDGVIALDPLVMSELLSVTGPVVLPDGFPVTASNVIDFVGHDEYVRYPDVPQRKALLGTLAADLFHAVIGTSDSVRTLQAFARAGSSGHLYLWSAHPEEQGLLGGGLVSGLLPTSDSPYLSVLTQNFGGDKLDYYVRRTVRVTQQQDGFLRVAVTLRNLAPTGLPLYMYVRSDKPNPPVPYGQAKVGLSVYGALSSEVGGVTVDGKPATMAFDKDHGHRLGTLSLELPRGVDVTLVVLLSEPPGTMVYRQQPLVVPDTLEIAVPHRVVGR